MGWRCALLLGLSWLATGTPLKADPRAAREPLHDCLQRASPGLRGIEALRAACPEIGPAMEQLGLGALLPEDWKARISARGVADLTALADRYTQTTARALPSPIRLQAIARLLEPPPASATWWERLRSWLASHLDFDRNRWPDWLRSLTGWRSGAVFFFYGSICLLVIAAVAVVVIELRAAGVSGAWRRRARSQRRPIREDAGAGEPSPGLIDVDAAAEHLRPALLLRLLVTALTRAHRLEREAVMTCRELIAAARFDNAAEREIFARVALLAEQGLYGDPRHATAPPSAELLSNASGLYRQLVAASAEQSAA